MLLPQVVPDMVVVHFAAGAVVNAIAGARFATGCTWLLAVSVMAPCAGPAALVFTKSPGLTGPIEAVAVRVVWTPAVSVAVP